MFLDQIQAIDRKKRRPPDLPPARRAIRIDRSVPCLLSPAASVAARVPHGRQAEMLQNHVFPSGGNNFGVPFYAEFKGPPMSAIAV
jgi:hypothetical protein